MGNSERSYMPARREGGLPHRRGGRQQERSRSEGVSKSIRKGTQKVRRVKRKDQPIF